MQRPHTREACSGDGGVGRWGRGGAHLERPSLGGWFVVVVECGIGDADEVADDGGADDEVADEPADDGIDDRWDHGIPGCRRSVVVRAGESPCGVVRRSAVKSS